MRIKSRNIVPLFLFLFALPASSNYEMHDYSMSGGGVGITDSGNYSMKAVLGEQSGQKGVGTTYNLGPGLEFMQQANVPPAPTFTNPSSYYNKLAFTLSTGGNPSDTLFAIAISSDDFATTNFIQADNTVGATAVYQTYATWGGGSGSVVIGLTPSTTYKIKVKAMHTKYSETEYSSTASATTAAVSLTYDLDVASTDTETSAPYSVGFGTLAVGSVTTATNKVWVDVSTNAENGAFVYLYTNGTGLSSAATGYTIASATTNLASASEGFGVQVATVAQTSGGPLAKVSPYDQSAENVGLIDTATRTILTTSNAPITAGRASISLKAKAATSTPSAGDFTSTITMIASGTF